MKNTASLEQAFRDIAKSLQAASKEVQETFANLSDSLFMARVQSYINQIEDGHEPVVWIMPQSMVKVVGLEACVDWKESNPSNWEEGLVEHCASVLVETENQWFLMSAQHRELASKFIDDGMSPAQAMEAARLV